MLSIDENFDDDQEEFKLIVPKLLGRIRKSIDDKESDTQAPLPPAVPAHIGVYKILARLGEGGMGKVYQARHPSLGKDVALKVLPVERANNPRAIARFKQELLANGALDHPNIARAHDGGEVDGWHFLVMEYLNGLDLSNLVRAHGPLSVADACEIIRQAALGLQHAYEQGQVHRDVKPSNLFLTTAGEVKVLDLGLALLMEEANENRDKLEERDQLIGTLQYMAPEQLENGHCVDIRADIYSLGATLYKLLCGRAPFSSKQYRTNSQLREALAEGSATPITTQNKNVPKELASVLAKIMAKDSQERYLSPAEVASAIEPFSAGCDLITLIEKAREARLSSVCGDTTRGTQVSQTLAAPSRVIAVLERPFRLVLNAAQQRRKATVLTACLVIAVAAIATGITFHSAKLATKLNSSSSSLVPQDIPPDPVVYMTFEPEMFFSQGEKEFIRDRSGNDLHAQISGFHALNDSPAGKRVAFDGQGYAMIPDHPRLRGGSDLMLSVAYWFHKDTGAAIRKFMSPNRKDWSLTASMSNLEFYGEEGNNDIIIKAPLPEMESDWNHAALVLDGRTGQMRFFLNGNMVLERFFPPKASTSTEARVTMGIYQVWPNKFNEPEPCRLDQLAIYDRVLSNDDVLALYIHSAAEFGH